MSRFSQSAGRWIFLAIIVIAALVRLATVRFGLPALNDPDELMFEMGAAHMLRDATLNPGWFGHPATTTMYVLALIDVGVFAIGWLLGWFAGPAAFVKAIWFDPALVILPGRVMIVICGVLTVALTARLGERLFDRHVGLAAAALLALDPVHVFWSQVVRSDVMASVFLLLCLLSTLTVARSGRWRDTLLASMWLGLAVATKWPFAAAGMSMAGACLQRVSQRSGCGASEAWRFLAFGVAGVAALVIASPFLVLDFQTAFGNVRGEVKTYHLGATGGSPLWNLGWYVSHPLLSAFGLAGLILVSIGIVRAAWNREMLAILGPPVVGFILLLVSQKLVWDRWALPLLPLLSIVAAAGAAWIVDYIGGGRGASAKLATAAVIAIATGGPLLAADLAQGRERLNDTRQQASLWIETHVRPGKTVLVEHFAFDLVSRPYRFLFPAGDAGCLDVVATLEGKIPYSTITKLRHGRSTVDIGNVAPTELASCRADYVVTTQLDRYSAEKARFPAEYGQYRTMLAGAQQVSVFRPEPGVSGGPITRIFKLTRNGVGATSD
ncbi:glycosyltransferase family 39 protein [Novosphingobium sp. ZN18A2]|uniref:glycosyltransferase family 39 protein n=1 Tax=Novosphingobium sp. ZN18A2 TaxID=3079861 RepID=UPI0030CBACA4